MVHEFGEMPAIGSCGLLASPGTEVNIGVKKQVVSCYEIAN